MEVNCLSKRYKSARSIYTCIYYLLTPDSFSSLHKLPGDEMFHFYMGDAVEMLQLHPDGTGNLITIGSDLLSGECPQVLVTHGSWQGSRLKPGGKFALLGTTMAPGFDFEDFVPANLDSLFHEFPDFKQDIKYLVRLDD